MPRSRHAARRAGLVAVCLAVSGVMLANAAAPAFASLTPVAPTLATEFGAAPVSPEPPAAGSALALESHTPTAKSVGGEAPSGAPQALGGARARILLQSLTVPGWGQASLGHNTAAVVFATIEAGIWTSFACFKVQEAMRTESSIRTAQLYAGIDLSGRDESFRRMVGQYPSSDSYNLYVVYRDAANQYYGDPAAMDAYIQSHSLSGADTWAWVSPESYTEYQDQRKMAQKAGLRANTALGLAVANRIVSALHAARYAGLPSSGHATHLELGPAGEDLSGGRVAITTHF